MRFMKSYSLSLIFSKFTSLVLPKPAAGHHIDSATNQGVIQTRICYL